MKDIELKWQNIWEEANLHTTDLTNSNQPYYTHVMFPYPSGDKLHIGHWYNYAPADTFARFKRMQGYNVCSPIGFDSFGLPAENYAIKTGVHPTQSIASNIETMITQLKKIGCMYDWEKLVNTSSPEYYKWTQWLFLQMYRHNLVYKKTANVNYCPKDQTVLANEQVHEGLCERCGTEVVQKPMNQWYWQTTKYAEELLQNLDTLDWPQKTKLMQQHWIGKSEGVTLRFKIKGTNEYFEAYDSVPQTFIAQTFAVIAPEHPLVDALIKGRENESVLREFIAMVQAKKLAGTFNIEEDMQGINTGFVLENPYGTGDLPIWLASFVLADYGTGMVMCSSHDLRDFAFAKKYNIPLRVVMVPSDEKEAKKVRNLEYSYAKAEDGIMLLPEQFAGRTWADVRMDIIDYLESKNLAKRSIQYRLRDWTISRQRYWGAPIPIVYDKEGKPHEIPEEHLPWLLPTDIDFRPDGTSPLARSEELKTRVQKIFGDGFTPEYDTMDTFVCSSFYSYMYLAHPKIKEDQMPPVLPFIEKNVESNWMPVQMYIGGPEHACMHLIYARFVTKALADMGFVQNREPYERLAHQGIITNQGAKMSKSKGNVISPDSFVEEYGSDVFRMYLMFMGPFTQGGDFSDTGIKGIDRFVNRIEALCQKHKNNTQPDSNQLTVKLHSTIKKITHDIEKMQFNTCIAALMELLNMAEKETIVSGEFLDTFLLLLAPLAPHTAEELWHIRGHETFIVTHSWPEFKEELLVLNTVTIVVQINGKIRGELEVDSALPADQVIALAKQVPGVMKYIEGMPIKKEIYVPKKLVSLVL